MTLTKARIVEKLYTESDFSKERCVELVESVFGLMKDELKKGNDICVSGFGKWSVNRKAPRRGRNPQTGKAILLDARIVVTFKCSGRLREAMNED